jgi:hypothetical protein
LTIGCVPSPLHRTTHYPTRYPTSGWEIEWVDGSKTSGGGAGMIVIPAEDSLVDVVFPRRSLTVVR